MPTKYHKLSFMLNFLSFFQETEQIGISCFCLTWHIKNTRITIYMYFQSCYLLFYQILVLILQILQMTASLTRKVHGVINQYFLGYTKTSEHGVFNHLIKICCHKTPHEKPPVLHFHCTLSWFILLCGSPYLRSAPIIWWNLGHFFVPLLFCWVMDLVILRQGQCWDNGNFWIQESSVKQPK